jgi:hypothetical protein
MKVRGILSIITVIAVFFMYSTQDLRAAAANNQAQTARTHAVSHSDLHQAVQASQQQANQARKSVQDFLARSEVRTQIQRLGIAPEKLMTQVAMLSDSDILHLQKQVMSADLQKQTSGLGAAAIVLIVIGGVAAMVLILYILYRASDENIYYY